MNAPTLFLTAALSAAVSAGVTTAIVTNAPAEAAQPAVSAPAEEWGREIARLRAEVADLSRARPLAAPRVAALDVRAEVERALAALRAEGALHAGLEGAGPLGAPDWIARLDGATDAAARQAIWKEIRAAGRTDEVIAAFEARAASAPSDPDLQVELGNAYLQKIQDVGMGPEAGALASSADAAFDLALEVDPDHWEARFTKAVALSFWPPVFGKKSASIQQFELLVQQQASLAPQPQHAQVHLLLGNLHMELGQSEAAVAAWQAGLALFPNDADLAASLALQDH